MSIVINGTGSISGLAVGGLPDGTVDDGTVASGIASSKLTGALPAISGASLTGITTGKVLQVVKTNELQKSGQWTDTSAHNIFQLAITPISASSTLHLTAVLTFQVYGNGNGNTFEMKMMMKEGSTDIVDGAGLHWNTYSSNNQVHFTPTHVQKASRAASSTNARTYYVTLQSEVANRRLQVNANYGGQYFEIIEVGA